METGFNSSCQSTPFFFSRPNEEPESKSFGKCVFFFLVLSACLCDFFSLSFAHIWNRPLVPVFFLVSERIKQPKIQPADFSGSLSRAGAERGEKKKRGERLSSTSSSLFLSLSLSRLTIRNHNNRWEPPPGPAWECSGIIASGTPSTIRQRAHGLREE